MILKFTFISMTAALIALFAVKLYPSYLFQDRSSQVQAGGIATSHRALDVITPPSALSIPSLGLSLGIERAKIVNNTWTLYEDKVSWLETSFTPGKGNVILYAHNRPNLFGGLEKLEVGDQIFLTHQGRQIVYTVAQKREVKPERIDAVLSDQDQLTLYTCDGVFDENRLVVIARPSSHENILAKTSP